MGRRMGQSLRYAAVCGNLGGLFSALAVMAVARCCGRGALAPLNATSHWIRGPAAGLRDGADLRHTGVGLATHQVSAMLWGAVYGLWAAHGDEKAPARLVAGALATGTIAGAVDYGLMPRRLTPGWEHALPKAGVVAGLAGLATGLAVGALALRR